MPDTPLKVDRQAIWDTLHELRMKEPEEGELVPEKDLRLSELIELLDDKRPKVNISPC